MFISWTGLRAKISITEIENKINAFIYLDGELNGPLEGRRV